MENASQALLIAGTILIALIVLSIGVYLVASYSGVGESYEQTQEITEITKFNTNFLKFVTRTDITAQEIITLKNFAQNYDSEHGTTTSVNYPNKGGIDAEFIKEYSYGNDKKIKYFNCGEENIVYGNDGRIISITFNQ